MFVSAGEGKLDTETTVYCTSTAFAARCSDSTILLVETHEIRIPFARRTPVSLPVKVFKPAFLKLHHLQKDTHTPDTTVYFIIRELLKNLLHNQLFSQMCVIYILKGFYQGKARDDEGCVGNERRRRPRSVFPASKCYHVSTIVVLKSFVMHPKEKRYYETYQNVLNVHILTLANFAIHSYAFLNFEFHYQFKIPFS